MLRTLYFFTKDLAIGERWRWIGRWNNKFLTCYNLFP